MGGLEQPTPEEIQELWGDPEQQSTSTPAESVTASPAKPSPGASPARPRRRTLLKKMQSAPDLSCPKSPSVWGIVQAVQKIQQDDESSQYSKKEEKFEIPQYKISVPLTPDAGTRKKLSVDAPLSTGRISERLPQMNQVPAIFDLCSTPKSKVEGGYTETISKAQQERILEILHPPMDDDLISAISGSTRKSRATTRTSKGGSSRSGSRTSKSKRSSSKSKRSSSKKRSSKLKKSSSAPDLFGENVFKRSTSDRTLFGVGTEESNEEGTTNDKKKTKSSSRKSLKKSKSDPSLALSPRKSSRRSSSKKLKKLDSERAITKRRSSKSPAKMKKSNSCPSLTEGAADKKKKKSKKLKKAGSERSLSTDLAVGGKKKKDRKPRRKSTSMLDDDSSLDPTFCAEAESLKAEVEERIRMAKQKLQEAREDAPPPPPPPAAVMETPPASSNLRKSGAHEEERIRVFAESMRRSASLSPSRFKLGDVDGFRKVESSDRRFGKSWSKVMPTPPTTPKKAIEWTRPKNIPPPIPVSDL